MVLSYLAEVVRGQKSKMCIRGGSCVQLIELYKCDKSSTVYDFGSEYYDMRISSNITNLKGLRSSIDINLERRKHLVDWDFLCVALYESSIYLERFKVEVPILLSKSLASYESEGIYIDLDSKFTNRLTESLFYKDEDYHNDNVIAEMLITLVANMLIMRDERLETPKVLNTSEKLHTFKHHLCFTKTNDLCKFRISYAFVGFTADEVVGSYNLRDKFNMAINRIIEIENINSPHNKRILKTEDYDNLYRLLFS